MLYALAPGKSFDFASLGTLCAASRSRFDGQQQLAAQFLGDELRRALKRAGEADVRVLYRSDAILLAIRERLGRSPLNDGAHVWVDDVVTWLENLPGQVAWGEMPIVADADGRDESQR